MLEKFVLNLVSIRVNIHFCKYMEVKTNTKLVSLDVTISLNQEEARTLLNLIETVNHTAWRGLPQSLHELRDGLLDALDPNKK